jgi:CMP-N,N'-diacetyllegionaminic acid synthase
MWTKEGELLAPLLEQPRGGVPLHSSQYQALPEVYVQNSSLEIAWTRVVTEGRTISGSRILAFETADPEGFSIDYPDDWERATALAGEGLLPASPQASFADTLN